MNIPKRATTCFPAQKLVSVVHWKRLRRGFVVLGLAGLLISGGCGGNSPDADPPSAAIADTGASPSAGKKAEAPLSASAQLIQSASRVPRQIIYNATVDLVAPNFSSAQNRLLSLIQKHGGYLAETNIGAAPGTPRQGTWKIRIPENQFDAFMAAVVSLGELQTTHTDSQDVTAEFYDLQARISNKQVEEKRLLLHLQRSTAKLSEILQVERELSRVRGEIEEMQGRLRLMANMASLTTITVTLHEVKGYVPPQPTTFGSQIVRAWQFSLSGLVDLGKNLVLVAVTLLPWATLFLLIGVPLYRLMRRSNHNP